MNKKRRINLRMSNLSGIMSLKKVYPPSPDSHQMQMFFYIMCCVCIGKMEKNDPIFPCWEFCYPFHALWCSHSHCKLTCVCCLDYVWQILLHRRSPLPLLAMRGCYLRVPLSANNSRVSGYLNKSKSRRDVKKLLLIVFFLCSLLKFFHVPPFINC